MKLGVACALTAVVVLVVVQPGKAWLICWGKKLQSVSKECPLTCKRYCPASTCRVVCAGDCVLNKIGATDKVLRPFPPVFERYDHNKDGFITLEELMKTLNADRESSVAALKLADDNGDHKLSLREFTSAPWSGAGKPKVKARRDVSSPDEPHLETETSK